LPARFDSQIASQRLEPLTACEQPISTRGDRNSLNATVISGERIGSCFADALLRRRYAQAHESAFGAFRVGYFDGVGGGM
jgi:hypothetical protein